jgi:hypothetical protein
MIDIEKKRTDKIPDSLVEKASIKELSVEDWVDAITRTADTYKEHVDGLRPKDESKN